MSDLSKLSEDEELVLCALAENATLEAMRTGKHPTEIGVPLADIKAKLKEYVDNKLDLKAIKQRIRELILLYELECTMKEKK